MAGYTREEIEASGLTDFRRFLIEVWAYLSKQGSIQARGVKLGETVRPTPVQLDIAFWLQHSVARVILQAFRGVGKSWVTVAFVLWTLLINPQAKIMVVSANEDTAKAFTKFCFQLIAGMPMLQHLAPGPGQLSSVEMFDVGPSAPSKDPSVKSVGITGQLTGSRADIIIVDDVEVPKNTRTPLLRDHLSNAVKEFDAVLKPGGRVIYLGTPQVEESLYVKLRSRGYTTQVWPVIVPEKPEAYKGTLAPFVQAMIDSGVPSGTPIDPKRFSEEDIAGRRLSYGASGFALQFMLDTSLQSIEQHPLKLRDLIITDLDDVLASVQVAWCNDRDKQYRDLQAGGFDGDGYYGPGWKSPEMAPYTSTVMYIDPSGMGTDETAYAIVKILHSQLYLVAVGGFKAGFAEATLKALAAKSLRHQVNYIIVEKNYGGGMFDQLLKPWLSKVVEDLPAHMRENTRVASILTDEEYKGWSKGQKELRILDTLEPIVQSHRLIVDRRVIEEDIRVQEDTPEYSFVQQFTRMWRQKGALAHEDRLEAVAGACQYFAEMMSKDVKTERDKHNEDLKDEELRRWMEHATGTGFQSDSNQWN